MPFRLLTLSAAYPHKNLAVLPQVAKILALQKEPFHFTVTVPEDSADWRRMSSEWPASDIVVLSNKGPVPRESLNATYSECHAVLLPTLLETFSATYPEAMAASRPILTSGLDFAFDICEESALYFDPLNPADIAGQILALRANPKLYGDLIDEGLLRLSHFPEPDARHSQILDLIMSASGMADANQSRAKPRRE
jgi:glycosyltransferase involved in cell wall biosynthesis